MLVLKYKGPFKLLKQSPYDNHQFLLACKPTIQKAVGLKRVALKIKLDFPSYDNINFKIVYVRY